MSEDKRGNDKTRAIEALTEAFRDFQAAIAQGLQDRKAGWFRLNVKLDRGRLMKVQQVVDVELFDHLQASIESQGGAEDD